MGRSRLNKKLKKKKNVQIYTNLLTVFFYFLFLLFLLLVFIIQINHQMFRALGLLSPRRPQDHQRLQHTYHFAIQPCEY